VITVSKRDFDRQLVPDDCPDALRTATEFISAHWLELACWHRPMIVYSRPIPEPEDQGRLPFFRPQDWLAVTFPGERSAA